MKRPTPPVNSRQTTLRCQFRIIGGQWRSRKFHFPDIPGLRPTPDRVRETLFNWLDGHIKDARCLDLFCGSGALGLEALSRGAAHCTFIDGERRVTAAIDSHLGKLQCNTATTLTATLPGGLSTVSGEFDVIFLDPPYALACITECLNHMVSKHLLKPDSMVYMECSSQQALPELPPGFRIHRHKTAGQVQYALLHWNDASMNPADPL